MVRLLCLAVIAVALGACDPGSLYDGPITGSDGGVDRDTLWLLQGGRRRVFRTVDGSEVSANRQ